MIAPTALISLNQIGKNHPRSETAALSDVSLEVSRGEYVAIIGSSGAGKSTLLNVIGLLERPSSGSYKIDGQDVEALHEREKDELRSRTFGFVFQSSHVLSDASVARNAALAIDMQNMIRRRQAVVVDEVLTQLGLRPLANKRAKLLSGGERQRLAIARAVASRPLILLADEPTGNLDSGNTDKVLEILRRLNQSGVTVILITHDERVANAADRTVRLEDGRIVADSGRAYGSRPPHLTTPTLGVTERRGSLLKSVLSDALASVTSNALRSAFLVLAFLLGAGGIVSAVGLSQSAAAQVSTRLDAEALDRVTVRLPTDWSAEDRRSALESIATLPGVERVSPEILVAPSSIGVTLLNPNSVPNQESFQGLVVGGSSSLLGLERLAVRPAQASSLLDLEWPVAIVGQGAAVKLGISTIARGSILWVDGHRVPVVGVITSEGHEYDNTIVLPYQFADNLDGADSTISIRTAIGYPAPIAEAVPFLLSPERPAAVLVETVADFRQLSRGVDSDFTVFVGAMAVAILVLASFSAATTIYLSVVGRRSEVALRRAVGASRARIASIFLAEGGILGLAGGGAGAAVGSISVVSFCLVSGWSPRLDVLVVGLSVGAGLITGLLAALVPAVVAARIDPAQAIR